MGHGRRKLSQVETIFSKHPEIPHVLDFAVLLRRYGPDDDAPGPRLAHLKGVLVQLGYLPHEEEDGEYFDIFDERSHHAAIGYRIIANDRHLVKKALEKDADIDELNAVAYLERLWVNPSMVATASLFVFYGRHSMS